MHKNIIVYVSQSGINSREFAKFSVNEIKLVPEPELNEHEDMKTISPVSAHFIQNNSKYSKHIGPDHPQYNRIILFNLLKKYRDIHNTEFPGKPFLTIQPKGEIKEKTLKIKDFDCKCFSYRFHIHTPAELMKIAYSCGIGSNNAMGQGMLKTDR
jgi:CRISPR-associated endoribonuclease Cas6